MTECPVCGRAAGVALGFLGGLVLRVLVLVWF